MPSTSIHELAIGEIERLSRRGFQQLALPEPLESGFEQSTLSQRSARLWIEGLIAIGFFNLYVIADHFIRGDTSWLPLQIRLCIVTPIALLVNVSMRWSPNKIYRETSIAVASCLIGIVHLYLESNRNATSSAYAQVGLIVAVIFVNVVMRLHFVYALSASTVLLVSDLVFIHHDHFLSGPEKLLGITLAICAISMTAIGNYSIGREERVGYLMRLRSEIQSRELSFLNVELQRISSLDSLTGLANRHSYELQFAKLWREAVESKTCISAIIIDIDHFKNTNDTRGHLYGDRVLVRVASLLLQSLRCKDDFAARFGGEEFVVLLPGATTEGALIVAERIRKLVEVAGSPALPEPGVHPRLSTVSCGGASCFPGDANCQEDLLDAADKALYRAKSEGRNRVCWGELAKTAKRRAPKEERTIHHLLNNSSESLAQVD
ncbi:GGDEF domain-containing protein [Tunturiibacter lichenicola]|uniref:GGDEF domain-containing protein n=1 Tax=Tunturiibacter lichenicola TaxID=2051959 RepID=UPI0021B2AE59|nr:GGDEF domain-containing protein [Edaphobacter lichenicola]